MEIAFNPYKLSTTVCFLTSLFQAPTTRKLTKLHGNSGGPLRFASQIKTENAANKSKP